MKDFLAVLIALLLPFGFAGCSQSTGLKLSEGDVTAQGTARPADPNAPYEPREGDVLFQSLAHNPLIDAIEGASESVFSHCGIVHQADGRWVVIEAIGPVKETPLANWIAQGRKERYAAYRLKEAYHSKIPKFVKEAQGYKGLPYDIHYDLNESAIYCSELIYKAFKKAAGEEMGRLQKLGDLKWQPHAEVIKQIEGGNVPLERKMITPRSLTEATQLDIVFSNVDRVPPGEAGHEP